MTLKPDDVIKVQTGLVVGFDKTVSYDIALAGGITTALFGGEGLFVTTLTGPGKVVLQSMDIAKIQRPSSRSCPGRNQQVKKAKEKTRKILFFPAEFFNQRLGLILRLAPDRARLYHEGNSRLSTDVLLLAQDIIPLKRRSAFFKSIEDLFPAF